MSKVTRAKRTKDIAKKTADTTEDQLTVEQWLAVRREAGLKIDPETAELEWWYGQVNDPYDVYGYIDGEGQCIGRLYFARSPGSDIWVWVYDLPDETYEKLWKRVTSKPAPPAGLAESVASKVSRTKEILASSEGVNLVEQEIEQRYLTAVGALYDNATEQNGTMALASALSNTLTGPFPPPMGLERYMRYVPYPAQPYVAVLGVLHDDAMERGGVRALVNVLTNTLLKLRPDLDLRDDADEISVRWRSEAAAEAEHERKEGCKAE